MKNQKDHQKPIMEKKIQL